MTEERLLKLLIRPVTDRLSQQDKMLEQILMEAKRTNGRVTALETAQAIGIDRHERHVRSTDVNRWKLEVAIGSACLLIGGAIGELLRAVGA